jgi:hypothetical protein
VAHAFLERKAHHNTAFAKAQLERSVKQYKMSGKDQRQNITELQQLSSHLYDENDDLTAKLDSCYGQMRDIRDDHKSVMDDILSGQVQPSLVWQLLKHICWLALFICAWELWLRKLAVNDAGQGTHAAVPMLQ